MEGSKVKVREGVVILHLIKWSHKGYQMKAHSLRYKMVYLMKEYDQKWKSYSKFNSSRYSENGKKIGCLDSLIQEAIQWMRLKLWLASCELKYFIWTEFRPILKGSRENFGWTDLELPMLIYITEGERLSLSYSQLLKEPFLFTAFKRILSIFLTINCCWILDRRL